MSRPSDRDDRKLGWRSTLASAPPLILCGWLAWYIIFERRVPITIGREISLSTEPGLFWICAFMVIVVPLSAVVGHIVWTFSTRRWENARIDRRLTLPLDKAARTPYEPAGMADPRPSLIIAVDGPAASGKGTIAARLAEVYGLPHLDTGLLYRAVGVGVLDAGGSLDDAVAAEAVARALDASHLSDTERLTSREAGEAASRVAGHTGVRAALLAFQKTFAHQSGGAVLDGRDIGTVIAPEAQAKLFVTATPEVRALRRWKQLTGRGEVIAYEDMLLSLIHI